MTQTLVKLDFCRLRGLYWATGFQTVGPDDRLQNDSQHRLRRTIHAYATSFGSLFCFPAGYTPPILPSPLARLADCIYISPLVMGVALPAPYAWYERA